MSERRVPCQYHDPFYDVRIEGHVLGKREAPDLPYSEALVEYTTRAGHMHREWLRASYVTEGEQDASISDR